MNIISDTIQSLTSMRKRQVFFPLCAICAAFCVATHLDEISQTRCSLFEHGLSLLFQLEFHTISAHSRADIAGRKMKQLSSLIAVGPSSDQLGSDCDISTNDLEVTYGSHKQREPRRCRAEVHPTAPTIFLVTVVDQAKVTSLFSRPYFLKH
jgi:hypothetical protein